MDSNLSSSSEDDRTGEPQSPGLERRRGDVPRRKAANYNPGRFDLSPDRPAPRAKKSKADRERERQEVENAKKEKEKAQVDGWKEAALAEDEAAARAKEYNLRKRHPHLTGTQPAPIVRKPGQGLWPANRRSKSTYFTTSYRAKHPMQSRRVIRPNGPPRRLRPNPKPMSTLISCLSIHRRRLKARGE